MVKIETHTFPNGLRIVYEKSKSKLPITTIFLFCDLGSLYEKEDLRGVSHFIEHMCFKGTKKILKTKDIFIEFDKSGSIFNASTFKQYTYYYIESVSQNLSTYLQVLSDMLMNSTFIKKEYDKEMKVVIEENMKNRDNKELILDNTIDRLIYRGCPLENPIDSLEYHHGTGYHYQKVVDTYRLYYQPHNMVLSIVSNLSFPTLLQKIKKTHFYSRRSLTPSILSNEKLVLYKPPAIQNRIMYEIRTIPHSNATYISIAFRTCSQHSMDKYVLNLLQYILGGFYNSRLFMLLREDNGLTYKTAVNTEYFEVMGDITLMAITDPRKLIENLSKPKRNVTHKRGGKNVKKGVLPLIIELLKDFIEKGITQEELNMAKHYIRGRMIINMDDQDTNAIYNGEQVLFYNNKNIIPYEKIYETYYHHITLEHVQQVIRRYFKKENMSVCLLGDICCSPSAIHRECEKIL
jgi:predicted Zn-dependent peptidase